MKKSVNKNKKSKLFTKRNTVILVVALAIFTPFAVHWVNQWLDYQDERKFQLIKNDVENLASKLREAYPSENWIAESSCHKAGVKFQKGSISCSVSINTDVRVADANNVRSSIDLVHSIVQQAGFMQEKTVNLYPNLHNGVSVSTDDIQPTPAANPYGYISYRSPQTNESCNMSTTIEADQDKKLNIQITCVDKARKEHF